MEITPNQEIWLNQQGGRDTHDVLEEPDGRLYVEMFNPEYGLSREKVYLPYQKERRDEPPQVGSEGRTTEQDS